MGKVTYSTLRNMDSIVVDDLEHCACCGTEATDCHHIYEGPDKRWSEKYLLMIPLCHKCHMKLHDNQEMNTYYKILGQRAFEREHPGIDFKTIFRKNYLSEE